MSIKISSHPSWNLSDEALAHLPPTHTSMGTLPPRKISDYHIAYANQETRWPVSYYENRVRALDFCDKERILDAGCGIGQWSLALARFNREVHSIDVSEERLAIAEILMRQNAVKNVFLTHGNIEKLPYAGQYFDAIFCYGVFMFLDPATTMREFARVLKPQGKLYICANGLGWSLYLIIKRRLNRIGFNTIMRTLKRQVRDNFLTKSGMERLFNKSGFRLMAWGGEGTIKLNMSEPINFQPVYDSRFMGLTAVFETVAEKADTSDNKSPKGPVFTSKLGDTATLLTLDSNQYKDKVSQERYLDRLVEHLAADCSTEQLKVERIIVFLQEAIFHDPIKQPPLNLSPFELLQLGEGRCGGVATLAADLLRRAGFASRTRQFDHHVIAEVFLDHQWRIVDADLFKNGVIPRNQNGQLLSMRDLEENPYQIDKFPPTGGLCLRTGSHYAIFEAPLSVLSSEYRGYISGYYCHWIPQQYPPSIPQLIKQPDHSYHPVIVTLAWRPSLPKNGESPRYRVRIGTTSKGYSFKNAVYSQLLNETGIEVGQFETSITNLNVKLERPGRYFWSVQAIDGHVTSEPNTFYWSSDEDSFQVY